MYRYGFNGKENDNEVKGEGNQQDYGMRVYDPRLGKFLSVDPITNEYPELTPYQFASNTPIQAIDLDGLEGFFPLLGVQEVIDIGVGVGRASTIGSGGGASAVSATASGALSVSRPFVSPNFGPFLAPFLPKLSNNNNQKVSPQQTVHTDPKPDLKPKSQPLAKSNPDKVGQKEKDDDKAKYIYRSMKADLFGQPILEESKRGLGVVPQIFGSPNNGDIAVTNGLVQPKTGGMSASPFIAGLPSFRKPIAYGGTSKDPVFKIKIEDLGSNLIYDKGGPTHGTVRPAEGTTYENYKKDLERTKHFWKKVD